MLKSSLGQESGGEKVPMDESLGMTSHRILAEHGNFGGSSPLPFPSSDAEERCEICSSHGSQQQLPDQ